MTAPMTPARRAEHVAWLRTLAEQGGKGVVNNIDARSLGRIADEIDRLTAERDAAVAAAVMAERETIIGIVERAAAVHVEKNGAALETDGALDLAGMVERAAKADALLDVVAVLRAWPVYSLSMSALRVRGVSRVFDNPRVLLLSLDQEPTDDQIRALHDALRAIARAAGRAPAVPTAAAETIDDILFDQARRKP